MPAKIYVDGQEGTTGLRINDYLAARSDVDILKIDPDRRKDPAERKRLLNAADVVFLCLPDAASKDAVAMIDNAHTKVIDASTAFRTDPAWAYGLPELSPAHRQKIKASTRIANPGCHATAFLLAVYPLISAGILPADALLTCFSLTGYSGGGKKMIAQYEDPIGGGLPAKLRAPRHYALGMNHKHLPEMQKIAGLTHPPLFTPVVCPVHSGLAVEIFLPAQLLKSNASPKELHAHLAAYYQNEHFVQVLPLDPTLSLDDGQFDITACNNTNRADLAIFGHDTQIVVLCRLDNLGKGAAGAAVQSLNLLLGSAEANGLAVR